MNCPGCSPVGGEPQPADSSADDGETPQLPLPPQLLVPEIGLTPARLTAIDGLVEEIAVGGSVRRLLMLGPRGVGKTSALSRAARLLHARGVDVVFVGADKPDIDPTPIDGSRRHLAVIVDDAQLLDRHASELIELPDRETNGRPVTLLFSAIEADQLTVDLRRALLRSDARFLRLGPMDAHEVADLVVERFRDASAPARRALTAELMRRSEGLPAVVETLIAMVDPATYTMIDPDPTDDESIETSIATANRYVAEGAYRKAVERLSALDRTEGVTLNVPARKLLVSSLYGMGALQEANRVRATLFNDALRDGDHQAAFRAAVMGLPDAEMVDGDIERLNQLLAVHHDQLPRAARQQHATATIRQAVYAGRPNVAWYWRRRAEDLADAPDHHAATAHASWHLSDIRDGPEFRRRQIDLALGNTSLSQMWQGLLHELRAIDNYEAGDLDAAAADYDILANYAAEAGDVLRTWHHLMFRTTVAFDAGRWSEAEEIRTEAMAHAMRNNLMGGEGLYVAQHFHLSWVRDGHGALVDMFPNIPPEIGQTRFGQAALVESLRAAGDVDRAVQLGGPLVDQVLAAEHHSTLGVLAFLARFIAQTQSTQTIDRAVSLLEPRSGTALLIGAGMASQGPVDRYLFQLTGDTSYLDRGIAFSDGAEYRLWQVLLRVEHPAYNADGGNLLSKQARNLADETDLTPLL